MLNVTIYFDTDFKTSSWIHLLKMEQEHLSEKVGLKLKFGGLNKQRTNDNIVFVT